MTKINSLFSVIVLLSCAFIMAPPVVAQEKAPEKKAEKKAVSNIPVPRIAVIDVQKILRDSKAAQALREQLDEERRKNRDEVSKQEDALRDSQQELNRQRTVLSAQAFEKKRQDWERQASDLNRDVESRKRKIDSSFEVSLAEIQGNLVNVVREIAKDQDITLVLAKTQVLLVSNEMDITGSALEELNKKLPSVKLGGAPKAAPKKK